MSNVSLLFISTSKRCPFMRYIYIPSMVTQLTVHYLPFEADPVNGQIYWVSVKVLGIKQQVLISNNIT